MSELDGCRANRLIYLVSSGGYYLYNFKHLNICRRAIFGETSKLIEIFFDIRVKLN